MDLTCEQAERLLSLHLDGELEPARRAEVEAHLAGCPGCRASLDAWARIGVSSIDLLRQAVPETPLRAPAPPVSERRLAALRARRHAGEPAPAWGIPAILAACLLVGLVVFLVISGRSGRPDRRPDGDRVAGAQHVPAPAARDSAPPAPPPIARRPEEQVPGPAPDKGAEAPAPVGPPPEREPVVAARDIPAPAPGTDLPAPLPAAPPAPAVPVTKDTTVPPPETAVFAARVEHVQGSVVLVTAAGRVPATDGQGLLAGQGIETAGRDGLAVLRYADGTRLELGADTAVSVPAEAPAPTGKAAPGRRVDVALGTLAAEVARQPADRPMLFATPHAEARVLGTRLVLNVSADATRLEVQEGRVRLTRLADRQWADVGGGQFAVASKGPPPFARVPPPPAPAAAWKDLFNGKDLSGWRPTQGRWSATADGMIVGEDGGSGKARIESAQPWGDFEMTCRIRVSGTRLAEFQIRNYALFAQLTIENPNAWRELKVVSRGTTLQATLDGRKVPVEPGEGGDLIAPGPVAFYVSKGGKIEIREARIREIGP